MFCPQCGQQQVSGDTRFCSRCGFQLVAVTGLLATGGLPSPTLMQRPDEPRIPSPRRKGVMMGGKMMLFSVFLIPMLAIVQEILNLNLDLPLLGVALFMGGILRLLYAALFQEGPVRLPKTQPSFPYVAPAMPYQQMGMPNRAGSELPPAHGMPARSFMPPQGNTSEIAPPPSVTENTTRLLNHEAQEEHGKEKQG